MVRSAQKRKATFHSDKLKRDCVNQLSTTVTNTVMSQLIKIKGLFGLMVLEVSVYD